MYIRTQHALAVGVSDCEENVVDDKAYGNIKCNQKRMELYFDNNCKVAKCVIVDGTKRAGEDEL